MRRGPFSPIFNPKKRYGHINPGVAVGETPTSLQLITTIATTAAGNGLALYGNHLVLVCDITGASFQMIDISTPTSPSVVGSINTTNLHNADEVAVDETRDLAVVTKSGSDRVTVVDISSPSSPSVVGTVTHSINLNGATGIGLYDDGDLHAAVACTNNSSLTMVNLSTPATPTVEGVVTHANILSPWGLAVVGGDALVCSSDNDRLVIVDISNPASPSVSGSVQNGTSLNQPRYVTGYAGTAFVSAFQSDALTVVDTSPSSSPSVVSSLAPGSILNEPEHVAMYAGGDFVLVSGFASDSVVAFDVRDTSNPSVIASVTDALLSEASGIVVSGSYAFVAVAGALAVIEIIGF